MRSLSLVMSECSLSGRGQGHASNFYIVNFENFATASRRYTGDIHNSTVVGLFMTPTGQQKRLDRVTVECTCLLVTHIHTLFEEAKSYTRPCAAQPSCANTLVASWRILPAISAPHYCWDMTFSEQAWRPCCVILGAKNGRVHCPKGVGSLSP